MQVQYHPVAAGYDYANLYQPPNPKDIEEGKREA